MNSEYLYKVYADGSPVNLDTIRVSAMPFNRIWPGKQRNASQTEEAYVLHIVSEKSVHIKIECKNKKLRPVIRPLSSQTRIEYNNNSAEFTLAEHGQYVFEPDGIHGTVHIFFDMPAGFEQKKNADYVFEKGVYHAGKIELKSGQSVYIGKEAHVYANICAFGQQNIKVFGYGVLDGGDEVRTNKHGDIGWDNENEFSPDKLHTVGCLRLFGCKNVEITGIRVQDSASYAMSFYACDGVHIDNVKAVGHWKYNNDGIDFINCRNVLLENTFIRSFDDSVCVKGFTAFSDISPENITVRNCVLWCGWGKTLEIGLATAAKSISNITFSECKLVHNTTTCLALSNGQYADVNGVLYENLEIEIEPTYEAPVYQDSDSQVYRLSPKPFIPDLINITDSRRKWQGNISADDEKRYIRNIKYRNIRVAGSKEFVPVIRISRQNECGIFENISAENLNICGKDIPFLDFLKTHGCDDSVNIAKSGFRK